MHLNRRILNLACILGIAVVGRGATEGLPLAPNSPAAVIHWAFAHADSIEVGYWDDEAKRFAATTLRADNTWRAEANAVVANATFRPRPYCFCTSPPLRFFRAGTLLLRMSIHHAEKLRLSVNPQLGELSGDFEVGEATASGLFNLADTRRRQMQAIRTSAESVLSR